MPNIDHTGVGSTLTFENEVVRAQSVRASSMVKGNVVEFHNEPTVNGFVRPAGVVGYWAVTYTDSTSAPGDAIAQRVTGILMEDIESGATGRVLVKGVSRASVSGAGGVVAAGSLLRVAWESTADIRAFPAAPTTGPAYYLRACGIALEASDAVSGPTLILFDGLNGFTASHP